MDDTDFDLLCKGLTPDEAKQLRKIFREWSGGDENDFPVQLALLTRAQWRAAAQMPVTLQKMVAAFETKLAAQQQQQAALMKTLREAGDEKIRAFDNTVAFHTEAMKKVAAKNCEHLDETEKFAREIRKQMEAGLRETDRITKSFVDERHRLEEACRKYEQSMEWREFFNELGMFILVAIGGGLFGYFFRH